MYDKYLDITEKLDRQLLERSEPPAHVTAREQLKKAGIKVRERVGEIGIIRVNPEAILFVNEFGKAMTAWSEIRANETVVFYCEAGMPAWPSSP